MKFKSHGLGIVLLGATINKTGNVRINVKLRRLRVNTAEVNEQKLLRILSVCLQPEVYSMQCACAILSSVACPVVQNFSMLPRQRHDFRKKKKVIEHGIYVLFLSTTPSEIFLIFRTIKRDMTINVYCSSCKIPGILFHILRKVQSSREIF
jgi:hypothetical protein